MDHCKKIKRKVNPRETANILSFLTFFYTGALFKKAYKHDLQEKDLYEVIETCNAKTNGDEFETLWKEEIKTSSPSTIRILWKRFGRRYLIFAVVQLTSKIIKSFVLQYAVGQLVNSFKNGFNHSNMSESFYYGGILIVFQYFFAFYNHNYYMTVKKLSIEVRTSFSSLIYRKALKLSPTADSSVSLGNVVTLLTKDVFLFEEIIWIIDLGIGVIQICFICFLLYKKLGLTCFGGLLVVFISIPIQFYLGKLITRLRLTIGKKTDERLQITQETLSAIKIIKMYTWEKIFYNKINLCRQKEVSVLLKSNCIKIIIIILGALSSRIGLFLLIMSYTWFGNAIKAEIVFSVITLFKDLRLILAIILPMGLTKLVEINAAIIRINKLLSAEEVTNKNEICNKILKPDEIRFKDVNVKINSNRILTNINLHINSNLTLITGKVGSGKSSLIKAILREYPLEDGTISTSGKISYASQEPWVFPSSIKQNILFGEKYEMLRYKEVLRICALDYDLKLLDKGDETIVADKGINLSKGQLARINLARAIYKHSDIYLLDDSLTTLDGQVQDFIFNNCIKGFLKNKLTILVTQNLKYLRKVENVIVLQNGKIKSFDKSNEISFDEIMKISEEISEIGELDIEENSSKKKVHYETNEIGAVNLQVYRKYIEFGGGFLLFLGIIIFYSVAQFAENKSDTLLSQWVDWQEKTQHDNNTNSTSFYANVAQKDSTINWYSIVVAISTVLNLFKSYIIFDFFRRGSLNIFKSMLDSIINAEMIFFDTHFLGNILNRFSQDLSNIDEHIPFVFTEYFRIIYEIIGSVILIIHTEITFIVPSLAFLAILIIMRYFYMPAGRSLKRLEAATRAPLVGHVNSTMEGLTTIRAYNHQQILKDEFDRHQDLFTSAHFTVETTDTAFAFLFELLCSTFNAIGIGILIISQQNTTAGQVGLTVTQILKMSTNIQLAIRKSADLENQMTSVERALQFTEITAENKDGNHINNFPQKGSIKYENVSLTYSKENVLKELNFSIEPNQKIGIVGRTGAGKTSVTSSLLRLYEINGNILIDNINIRSIAIKCIRQSIAIIPQDPILFTGTIRSNIDPNNNYTDDEIWRALDKAKSKYLFENLNTKILDCGSQFSSGQKQLICLARAIIRKNKIVVLDEATSNMDFETALVLQDVIKENFKNCTVLIIAHRLDSIMDSDKIMVLDKGEIVEFENPSVLLQNSNGMFYKMMEHSKLL